MRGTLDMREGRTVKPGCRRELVRYLQDQYRVSERRGCAALRFDRSSHRYRSIRDDQVFLRHRIREIASTRIRYGYRRIYLSLRRDGLIVNHKRVRRLYREEGLNLRIKRPHRHVSAAHRIVTNGMVEKPGNRQMSNGFYRSLDETSGSGHDLERGPRSRIVRCALQLDASLSDDPSRSGWLAALLGPNAISRLTGGKSDPWGVSAG